MRRRTAAPHRADGSAGRRARGGQPGRRQEVERLGSARTIKVAVRVIAAGSKRAFTAGSARLDGSRSTIVFRVPGEAGDRSVDVRPAQAAVGDAVTFDGSGLEGDQVELRLRMLHWADAVTVGADWGVAGSGTGVTVKPAQAARSWASPTVSKTCASRTPGTPGPCTLAPAGTRGPASPAPQRSRSHHWPAAQRRHWSFVSRVTFVPDGAVFKSAATASGASRKAPRSRSR